MFSGRLFLRLKMACMVLNGMAIQMVPLDEIVGIADENVRKEDPVQNLEDLKSSMEDVGFTEEHALLLREVDSGYEIVAGRRRYNAAKELGLEEVPATIEDLDETEAFKRSALENIQSESLTTPQKKRLVQESLKRFGTLDRASQELSKPKQTLRDWEPFITLPDEILEMVEEESTFHERDARVIGQYTTPAAAGQAFEDRAIEKAELMAELPKNKKDQLAEIMKENPGATREDLEQMLEEEPTPIEITHEITGKGAEAVRREAENRRVKVEPEELVKRQIDQWVENL